MPKRPTKGVVTIYLEVPPAIKDDLQGEGEYLTAVKRHSATPAASGDWDHSSEVDETVKPKKGKSK